MKRVWLLLKHELLRTKTLLLLWICVHAVVIFQSLLAAKLISGGPADGRGMFFAFGLFLLLRTIVSYYIPPLIVHVDSPMSTTALWRTRPIRPGELFLAKYLAVAVFLLVIPVVTELITWCLHANPEVPLPEVLQSRINSQLTFISLTFLVAVLTKSGVQYLTAGIALSACLGLLPELVRQAGWTEPVTEPGVAFLEQMAGAGRALDYSDRVSMPGMLTLAILLGIVACLHYLNKQRCVSAVFGLLGLFGASVAEQAVQRHLASKNNPPAILPADVVRSVSMSVHGAERMLSNRRGGQPAGDQLVGRFDVEVSDPAQFAEAVTSGPGAFQKPDGTSFEAFVRRRHIPFFDNELPLAEFESIQSKQFSGLTLLNPRSIGAGNTRSSFANLWKVDYAPFQGSTVTFRAWLVSNVYRPKIRYSLPAMPASKSSAPGWISASSMSDDAVNLTVLESRSKEDGSGSLHGSSPGVYLLLNTKRNEGVVGSVTPTSVHSFNTDIYTPRKVELEFQIAPAFKSRFDPAWLPDAQLIRIDIDLVGMVQHHVEIPGVELPIISPAETAAQ